MTHLCLRGHPEVCSLNDEMRISPFFTDGVAAFTYGAETERERDRGWLALFDAITTLELTDDTRACGLKAAINSHEEAIVFVNCLRMHLPDVKVILVNREDLVAQCGSWVRGEKSGQWHSWANATTSEGDPGTLTIETDYFSSYAAENAHIVAQLRTLADTHDLLEFSFERQIADGSGWPTLFDHLGISAMPVTWLRSSKVAPSPEEYIGNHDELKAIFDDLPAPSMEEERAAAMRHLIESFSEWSEEELVETTARRDADGQDIELHRSVLRARPAGERWLAYLEGRLLSRDMKFDEAITRFDRFLEQGPHVIVLLHRAFAHNQLERWRAAHDDVAAAFDTERFPQIARETQRWAFEMIECALTQLNDALLAQHTLDRAEPRLDRIPYFHFLQGIVHHATGDTEAGKASLRTAVELDPSFAMAKQRLDLWSA